MRSAAVLLSLLILAPPQAVAAVAVRLQSKASVGTVPQVFVPGLTGLSGAGVCAPVLKTGLPVLAVNPSPVVNIAIQAGLAPSADLGSESQSAEIGRVFDGFEAPKAQMGAVDGSGHKPASGLKPHSHASKEHRHGPPSFWEKPPEERPKYVKALWTSLAVGGVFFAVELIGSMMTGSLALRADAVHLAADLSVIAAALFAWWKKDIPKIEPVIGLLSAALIGATAVHMGFDAWERFQAPEAVGGLSTMLLACAGLASNVLTTLLLYKHRDESLSLKAAFLHSLSDALGSLGIIASGAATLAFGWRYADPVMAVIIAAIIAKTTWTLARNSLEGLRRAPRKK